MGRPSASPSRIERHSSARLLGLDGLVALALALLAYFAFRSALTAGFVNYDDEDLIVAWAGRFQPSANPLRFAFTTTEMGHYQPLTWLSWTLDFAGSGLDPRAFHRTNLLLHCISAALVYFVVRALLRSSFQQAGRTALTVASASAAALWAVHPLRVESVAWATERRDVLSACLLLAAFAAYLRAVTPGSTTLARGWNRVALALYVLSLLSKGWGMTFVLVLLIADVVPLRRLPPSPRSWWSAERREVLLQKLPYAVLGIAAAIVAAIAQTGSPDTARSLAQWGILERCAQAAYGLVFYVEKSLWPSALVAVRELPYRFDFFEARFIGSAVVVLAATAVLFALRRRAPGLVACALVYAILLAPVLGFLQSGPQIVADRYSYLSAIPWSVALGAGVCALLASARGARLLPTTLLVTALSIGTLLVLAQRQTRVWHDSGSLWEHAFECGVPSSIAWTDYGRWQESQRRTDDAIESYRKAVVIRPDQGNAWYDLGILLQAKRQFDQAEHAYLTATTCYVPALRPWSNLGNLYFKDLQRIDDAIHAYVSATRDAEGGDPRLFSPLPYLNLGSMLDSLGRKAEARPWLERAARYPETRAYALRLLAP